MALILLCGHSKGNFATVGTSGPVRYSQYWVFAAIACTGWSRMYASHSSPLFVDSLKIHQHMQFSILRGCRIAPLFHALHILTAPALPIILVFLSIVNSWTLNITSVLLFFDILAAFTVYVLFKIQFQAFFGLSSSPSSSSSSESCIGYSM